MDLYHILILVGRQVLTHLGEAGNWSLYDAQMEADRSPHLLVEQRTDFSKSQVNYLILSGARMKANVRC